MLPGSPFAVSCDVPFAFVFTWCSCSSYWQSSGSKPWCSSYLASWEPSYLKYKCSFCFCFYVMFLLLLLAIQWLQAMMLLLLMLPGSLVALSCDSPLPCDFFHVLLFSSPMAPSHDAPFVHASWWFSCSKLWCSSYSCFLVVQLLQAMMFLMLLFHNNLVVIGLWYFCFFFFMMLFFVMFFCNVLKFMFFYLSKS